jgi:hypothetical protein
MPPECAGSPVGGGLQIEGREHLRRASDGVALRHAVEPALDHELASAGFGRVGRAPLGHVADPLAHELRLTPEIGTSHRRLARGRGDQRREHSQRGRLARAVGPEEPEDLPGSNPQIDALDSVNRTAARLEGPPEV